jgi:hypothetical protein
MSNSTTNSNNRKDINCMNTLPEVHRECIIEGMCTNDTEKCKYVYSDENIGDVCRAYIIPATWKRMGGCPLSSIAPIEEKETVKKINPLKASKRSRRKK